MEGKLHDQGENFLRNQSNDFGSLSEEEIQQIVKLVETLEHSSFDFLRLELGDLKLTIGKGNWTPDAAAATAAATAPVAVPPRAAAPAAPAPAAGPTAAGAGAATAAEAPAPVGSAHPADDGTVVISAPIVGRFYARPEPGAPPFVTVGAEVDEDTTVGLIEVMKVFNAVRAGVGGVITEMCVQDAQFIEFGQPLFRVRPSGVRKGAPA